MNKKIFLIGILFLITLLPVFSDSEIIETELGDVKVFIPDTYDELKEYYLELMGLYLDQKSDLNESIENTDELIETTEELQEQIGDLIEVNKELIDVLNMKVYEPLWMSILFTGLEYNFMDKNYEIKLGYGALIADSLYLSAMIGYPFSITIMLGVKL